MRRPGRDPERQVEEIAASILTVASGSLLAAPATVATSATVLDRKAKSVADVATVADHDQRQEEILAGIATC